MADWNLLSLSQSYSAFVSGIRHRDEDTARMFDGVGSNIPDQTIRWNSGADKWEIYSSASAQWNGLTTIFDITVSGAGYASSASDAILFNGASSNEYGKLADNVTVSGIWTFEGSAVHASAIVVGGASGGSQGTGTINAKGFYIDGNEFTGGGATISGFNIGENVYIESSAAADANALNLDSVLITNWKTIGPTGSGATQIWSALDAIPAGAGWAEIKVRSILESDVSGDTVDYTIHCANAGKTGSAAGSHEEVIHQKHLNFSGTNDTMGSGIFTFKAPLDSSNIFTMKRFKANVSGTITYYVSAFLVGFGA